MHRLHPLSWVFESVRNLRGAATAVFFLFVAQRGDFGSSIFMLFLAPVLLFTGVLGPLLKYLTFRYRLEDDELVILEGVLSRNERRLAYSRVQNIDLVENPFHRLFRLAVVRLETASGGKPEATMHLAPVAIDELRRRVFSGRAGSAPLRAEGNVPETGRTDLVPEVPTGPTTDRKTLLKLGYGDVVRLGLIQNRGMVLVAAAFGLFFQQNFIDWDTFGNWFSGWIQNTSLPDVQVSPLAIAAGGLVLLFIWFILIALLSVIFALFRFANFELTREGEDLRARFGLLTRVAMTVPRGRIQRVWSRQTLLHKLFGRMSIRLDTAGGSGDGATGRHWLAPVTTPDRQLALVLEALPELDEQPLRFSPDSEFSVWRPVAVRAWKRLFRRWTILSALPLAIAAALVSPWILLALVPLTAFYGIASRRVMESRFYAVTNDAILTRSGWLSTTLSIVRFEKIQAVAFRQSPFDRRHRMGSIHIDTAGASLGTAIDLDYIDESLGIQITDLLYREAAQRSFRWS